MTRREVRETYERIAPHFARTRPEPWGEVVSFLEGRSGGVGLDVGVGNGRHAELLAHACDRVVGLDVSHAAVDQAQERSRTGGFELDLVAGDAASLPVADRTIDVGVYVATLHHLPSRRLRVASLDELARVLRRSGRAIVSAWSVSHDRFEGGVGFDTTVDWTLPDGEVVERFYHVYDLSEFATDLDDSRLVRTETFESCGNCYAVVGPEG